MNQMSKATVAVSLALACCLAACQGPLTQAERSAREAAVARATKGRALFEEKCRTVAGEKIYRTVRNVEGITLLRIRPVRGDRELSDLMWPGAAFAREASGDEYIVTFLGYEHSSSPEGKPVNSQYRGYIGTDYQPNNASNLPGYRFVDVVNAADGRRYRYTGSQEVVGKKDITAPGVKAALQANPNYDLNVYGYRLRTQPVTGGSPRYAVTFEDHVIAAERAVGVASSTITVIDLETRELLGELTRYAWTPTPSSPINPTPWLTAYRCPDHAVGTGAATRKFVDQILVPYGR